MKGGIPSAFVALGLVLSAGAGEPRFERRLLPQGPGPASAAVDVPLLAGGRPLVYRASDQPLAPTLESGLEDLRLFAADGREVPYLLVFPQPQGPSFVAGRSRPIPASKAESGFEVDLGSPRPVDQLALSGLPAPFLKRFRLEGSGDRQRWIQLVAEGTLFDLPAEGLNRLAVDFEPAALRYLRVVWDDHASGRLPIPSDTQIRLAGPTGRPALERAALEVERRESEPGKSRFRLTLPGARLPAVAIELSGGGATVLREARLSEARLGEGRVTPQLLGRGELRRVSQGGMVAEHMSITVARPAGAELELVVDDGDNPPFELSGASAVLAPLPWIYFESPDGAPLLARFGDARASAPRYDLEAKRGQVSVGTTRAATWEPSRQAEAEPEPPALAPQLAGSVLATTGFRWRRDLPPARPGLNAVTLDSAALAHSRGLADLRLVDGQGRQVPYLLEERGEPLVLELSLEPLDLVKAPDGRQPASRYRLVLPQAGLPGGRLLLETRARVFERPIEVWGLRPAGEARESQSPRLAAQSWSHADPELPPPKLVLDLPRLEGGELVIAVHDGDNTPLPLEPPKLLLPAFRLRFFGAGEPLVLFYGDPSLSAPRYDLALLAPRLVGAAAHELELGPEHEVGDAPGSRHRLWFWGALVVAVVGLLALVVRLLRQSDPV